MCGRFTQRLSAGNWSSILGASVPDELRPNYNVAPTQRVLTFDGEATLNEWSFLPGWAKGKDVKPVINARIETAAEKPYFRSAWKHGRCVIAGTGFIEWQQREGGKHPHHITLVDDEPFGFAALRDGDGVAICTTEPNELMATIHNRMPVILRPEAFDRWLGEADWRPLASDEMQAVEIGTAINSPRNNDPSLLQSLT